MDLNAREQHSFYNENDTDGYSDDSTIGNRKVFVKGSEGTRFHYNPDSAPQFDDDEQSTIILNPSNIAPKAQVKRSPFFRFVQAFAIFFSLGWSAICILYFVMQGGLTTQTPYEFGIFIAGMTTPVAFLWMFLGYLQRHNDVKFYAENLRAEMQSLFFPSEEESRLVNKDIERMTRQAAELAASSKAAMKSIQRTRQGLRHEIKEFANFARKAESHLISLSDSLVERTGQVTGMVDSLEERMGTIEARSQSAVMVWDEASARMVERSADIEAAMEQGSNRILSMAEMAEERSKAVSESFDGTISSLGLTVDAAIERLSGIEDKFGSHTRSLEISSEELAKETNRIGMMIDDQIAQLQDAAGRSVESITQSLVSVSEHKDLLEESANILTSRADTIADVINGSVTKLTETSEGIIARAEETESRLSEKATVIASALDNVEMQVDRIDSVSEIASHRLSEGIETAVNGSQQIGEAVRRAVETLTRLSRETTEDATSLIDAATAQIKELQDSGQGNIKAVEQMIELFDRSRQQIEKSAVMASQQAEELWQTVDNQTGKLETSATSLADQVKAVSRSLEEPMRLVNIAVADADSRHEQIRQTLDRRIADLRDASEKAGESVEVIRQSLREQTNEISTLSGRVLSQSKALNTELADNKSQLTDTIDTALTDMNRLMEGLESKSNLISQCTRAMLGDISEATENLELSANRMRDTSLVSKEALKLTGEGFLETSMMLETKIAAAETNIETANRNLSASCERILPLYDRVEKGARASLDELTTFKESCEQLVETSLSKIGDATTQFEGRLVKLQACSDETQSSLKTTATAMRDTLGDIEFAAETANDKMYKLTHSMETQSSDIHILTDQATLKMEGIQKLVDEQFRELSGSVGMAVSQIEEAGEKFSARAEKISDTARLISDSFTDAGDEAQAKAYALKQAVVHIGDTTHETTQLLSSHIGKLRTDGEEALSNLVKTADSMTIKSKEIDVMMQSVLGQANSYANDMREQVRAVAEQSDQTAQSVSKSIASLLTTMDGVNEKTKLVVDYIEESNQSLYDQSGRFVTAVSKSAQAAEHATEIFSTQTDNLLKASRYAVEKIEDIRKAELRAGRETFLSSARFVLESLHSLSIDFIRVIDGEVAEKDWKTYQKGDIALFTSKLADRLDQMPADKIRHKYAEDGEFRNYVQKFMRQFEDVLDQTDTVDRGAVLGTTFAASDVGKIYRFLCNVTGRHDRAAA